MGEADRPLQGRLGVDREAIWHPTACDPDHLLQAGVLVFVGLKDVQYWPWPRGCEGLPDGVFRNRAADR